METTLTFHGGTRTVTGSMHLVSTGAARFLIDCGMFQGRRDESFERNSTLPFEPASIDACVLSHAHIDHSGNLPTLVKRGFAREIVTTEATRDLCGHMLPDSGHIQEEDVRFVNKINAKRGIPPRVPLYTKRDGEEALRRFRGVPYRAPVEIVEGTSVTFYDAGHVLGSAIPVFELRGRSKTIRLAYAVDLGRRNVPILRNPEHPPPVDYLIMESTYGGRMHAPIEEAKESLARAVREAVERRGKIIVPSFALERTQEVVYFLGELLREGRIPEIPIYVDSPLAVNLTDVFRSHRECYDAETLARIDRNDDPFGTKRITYVTEVADSIRLNDDHRPMIIISASGMCESGRILHHLRNNIENPRTTIVIVGYMAANTLGRRIVERDETVRIFGQECKLAARVVIMNSFSGHADRGELLEFAAPLRPGLRGLFLVHGESDQTDALAAELRSRGFPVRVPNPGEQIALD